MKNEAQGKFDAVYDQWCAEYASELLDPVRKFLPAYDDALAELHSRVWEALGTKEATR